MSQDVGRFVVAALVLEDLHATVDRTSDPKAGGQTSREREPAEWGHGSWLHDKWLYSLISGLEGHDMRPI